MNQIKEPILINKRPKWPTQLFYPSSPGYSVFKPQSKFSGSSLLSLFIIIFFVDSKKLSKDLRHNTVSNVKMS